MCGRFGDPEIYVAECFRANLTDNGRPGVA